MAPELSDLASHQSPSLGRETENVEEEGQTDRVCLLTLHTARPDPALPHPSLLSPLSSRHLALVLSDGAQAELGCPAWVLQGVPKAQRLLPGVGCECWG